MSFALYVFGYLILMSGLIYGAVMLHMPTRWIVVAATILLGTGVITAVTATRQKDPAS
jgi:uncharacterized membrane protein